ncbi:MAG: hypothetical protein IJZ39_12380 [Oscillospiraceae bacterium]|nr:hypothetical protein [Oscillospiraceae bacterium]
MDKTQIKQTVHGFATQAASKANENAKSATGWKKWLWAAGAIIAGAVAWFTQSCTNVTPQQVHAAHVLYHAISGEPCTIAKPSPVVVPTVK